MKPRTLLPTLLMVVGTFAFVAAAPPTQLSIEDARADFAAEKYQPCLQKISDLLMGNMVPPGSPERYDLLVLRGECMLRLKNGPLAAAAFDSAEGISKRMGDLKRSAAARATAVLIRQSAGLRYRPVGSGGEEIDIVAPDSRVKAMRALLDDQLKQLKPRIADARKSTSLLPLQKLLPDLANAYALDSATSDGKADETLAIARELGGHARELMTSELDRLGKRVEQLNDLASAPTFGVSGGAGVVGARGLNTNERKELMEIADYLTKIRKVGQEGRRINRSLGGDGSTWDAILADCNECMETAQAAYDRRY